MLVRYAVGCSVLVVCLVFLHAASVSASSFESVSLNADGDRFLLGPSLSYLKDDGGHATIEDILVAGPNLA